MKLSFAVLLTFTIFLISCNPSSKTDEKLKVKSGIWRASLKIDQTNLELEIPFMIDFTENSGINEAYILNANEKISVKDISIKGDSIFVRMPVFDSEIKAKIEKEKLTGHWFNYVKGDYSIPFIAEYGNKYRFKVQNKNSAGNISGKWHTTFGNKPEESSAAIGEFIQKENIVTGTFLTETGDYRYLEGVLDGNQLKLSCFDGSHAFLFTADYSNEKLINGVFYSGKHWKEKWQAEKNDELSLTDPFKLTYLKEGYETFEIQMPDLEGNLVKVPGDKYKDKVLIIQIMGSWCPNCVDETTLLANIYNEYAEKGLEIISIAFEATEDPEKIKRNINRLKEYTGADYKFLIGGKAGKANSSAKLPMLNHIISYPTTIFIDKKGEVRKIHTGFNGPGTGKHYNEFVMELKNIIEELLSE